MSSFDYTEIFWLPFIKRIKLTRNLISMSDEEHPALCVCVSRGLLFIAVLVVLLYLLLWIYVRCES